MIKVKITEQMYNKAMIHAVKDKEKHGNHNTLINRTDKARLIGSLGEEVISNYFNIDLCNTRDFDIIINQQYVEIKSQNININVIKPDFRCTVMKPSIGCDRYMFVFVHSSLSVAWIVGTCSREEFESKSFYICPLIKGIKTIPSHNILIKDLEDVESWLSR